MKYFPLIARVLLTFAFGMAGGAKLLGAQPMVEAFDMIGLGQWFRIVTGLIEVGSVVMLWVKPVRTLGALLLGATMVGAIIAHVVVLGPSFVPAAVLGLLTVIVIYYDQKERRGAL